MKKIVLLTLILSSSISLLYSQSGLCDVNYWNHTYSNARLKIYDSCVTITGVIKNLIPPAPTGNYLFGTGDGDYHIYVQPDSEYQWMTSFRDTGFVKLCEGSDSGLYVLECATCLNVEEVCKGAATDGGAVGDTEAAACTNFNDTVYLPNVNERVRVTGPFIYDTVHCWNELHPVSSMVVGYVTGIPEPEGSSFLDGMKIYPQPAAQYVAMEFVRPPHAITLIKFYNPAGQKLYVYAMAETNVLVLDVTGWASGEYPYNIVSQEQGKTLKRGILSVVH